ncbi:hypothetical protein CIHG_04243 [Coccidioides immitis H538.4]|uniref:Uncharacterized protein n=2 Tax=Coccidioides immitis TaxID=5501 RepID=A0A0J8RR53_COCIT|nr:hypothetical protein CIRG_04632 [Coccidioides immitis RMSCC 2394]KMU86454.1 hypothetical protein CIHG_04243 [Coccidioides immitis H538.4]
MLVPAAEHAVAVLRTLQIHTYRFVRSALHIVFRANVSSVSSPVTKMRYQRFSIGWSYLGNTGTLYSAFSTSTQYEVAPFQGRGHRKPQTDGHLGLLACSCLPPHKPPGATTSWLAGKGRNPQP